MRKAILITGSHRSGSTWVGRMIAQSPNIAYIHEPFNVSRPPGIGICAVNFEYWFTYICTENEVPFYQPIKNTINFSYNLIGAIKQVHSRSELVKIWNQYKQFIRYRLSSVRPLIKDPIALFSAEKIGNYIKAK